MAITKIHPIKTTLKAAIDYISNPHKTNQHLLISSYMCQLETADIEFEYTRRYARSGYSNLGRHLIQSFKPGEVSEDKAHQIGIELANRILKNEYEYVIATHNDKGHIHNHIIFNSVNYITHKQYRSNKATYHQIRRVSDEICKEYGLSIIEESNHQGLSYIEYNQTKIGKSHKQELRKIIDKMLPFSNDLDDLLMKLSNNGYVVKKGKYISIKGINHKRYTRLKTLGDNYNEEILKDRLNGKTIIGKVIDIKNNEKAKTSKGYEHFAKIHNLKEAAKTYNYMKENHISFDDISSQYHESLDNQLSLGHQIIQIENDMKDIKGLIKQIKQYQRFKPIYDEYKKSKDQEKYLRGHESEIILFEAAKKQLKARNLEKIPFIKKLETRYQELSKKHQSLEKQYKLVKQETKHFEKLKKNMELTIGKDKSIKYKRTHEIE